MNKYVKYVLWVIGGWVILESIVDGGDVRLFLGIVVIGSTFIGKIRDLSESYSRGKTSDELLKLKELLDKNIITQDEYNLKSKTLKDKL